MARRRRRYTPGVGAAVSLLAGCLGGPAARTPEAPPAPDAAPVASAPAPPPAAPSSYHARVVELPPVSPPRDIERVAFQPPPAPPPAAPPAEAPRPPESPLVQALRCVLDRQPAAALDLLQRYDARSREVLLALLEVAAPLGEGGLEHASPQETAALLDRLDGLQASLRRRAPLVLEKMCFCREIRNFGKYDPLPPDHAFQAGSDGRPGERVQVYVEVRNFACRPRGGAYETALQGHVEIHDFRGAVVWEKDFDYGPDRSATPRQDYFLAFIFNVPPRLAPGSGYTLWVYVKDTGEEGVRRAARRSLDFRVCPPHRGGLAASAGGA